MLKDATNNYAFAFTADSRNLVGGDATSSPVYQGIYNLTTDGDASNDPAIVFQIGDWDHRDPGHPTGQMDLTCGEAGQPACITNDWQVMHRDARGNERLGINQPGLDFKVYVQKHFAVEHIWDNHDYAGIDYHTVGGPKDNIADAGFQGRPNALEAFTRYHPLHMLLNPPSCVGTNCTGGLWRSFTYGNVDFFVLDLRTQRDNIPTSTGSTLGADQVGWLQAALAVSKLSRDKWKIIITSLPFNPVPKKDHGAWGNFSTERRSILDYISTTGIKNVVLISGDLHSGGAIDYGQQFLVNGQTDPIGLPEASVPHTNIVGNNPVEKYDTACGAPSVGMWKIAMGSTTNDMVSGAAAGVAGGCTQEGLSAGGSGYVLVKVSNTTPTKTLTLQVMTSSNTVRTGGGGIPLTLTISMVPE